jgi:hypothetical protein
VFIPFPGYEPRGTIDLIVGLFNNFHQSADLLEEIYLIQNSSRIFLIPTDNFLTNEAAMDI